jgi:hypothetical protein
LSAEKEITLFILRVILLSEVNSMDAAGKHDLMGSDLDNGNAPFVFFPH